MKLIPRLKEGEEWPNFFSAEFANMLIDTCNAVRLMRGVNGTKIFYADTGIVVSTSGSFSTGSFVSGSAGSGSITTVYDRSDTWM